MEVEPARLETYPLPFMCFFCKFCFSLSLFWVNQPSLCTDVCLSYPHMIQEYGATVILRVQINVRHIRGRCIVAKLSPISISLIWSGAVSTQDIWSSFEGVWPKNYGMRSQGGYLIESFCCTISLICLPIHLLNIHIHLCCYFIVWALVNVRTRILSIRITILTAA